MILLRNGDIVKYKTDMVQSSPTHCHVTRLFVTILYIGIFVKFY